MARSGIGVDIGSSAIHIVVGADRKGVFQVQRILVLAIPAGAATDAAGKGEVLAKGLAGSGIKGEVLAGLTGRDLMIRYNQVPPVPEWQLRQLMDFEIQELIGQSGEPLAADYNLVPVSSDLSSDDTVLLALAKEGVLNDHLETLGHAGLGVRSFTPNPIALFNAWRKTSDDSGTLLLINVGARNSDLALVVDGELLFARNLSGGGELFDEALKASFNVGADKARKLKEQMANVAPFDRAANLNPQEEKVSRSLAGATGQILSMIQSSVTFARTQTGRSEIKLDRVLLSGGSSLLKGLDKYLEANLGVEVRPFDPFAGLDTTAADEEADDAARASSCIALGLALQAAYSDCYSIEVLPAPLKKARQFKERTVFAVLAAVLAVAYLGFDAWKTRADYAAARQDSRTFGNQLNQLKRRREAYDATVVNHAEGARKLDLLEERVVPGLGLSRTLALVQKYLPQDLYVRSIKHGRSADQELGIIGAETRPVVVVQGEGREGTQGLATVFNRFVTELGADPLLPNAPKTVTSAASGNARFQWTLTMNFSKRPSTAATAGTQEDGG